MISYLQSVHYLNELPEVSRNVSCNFNDLIALTASRIDKAILKLTQSDFETDSRCIGKNLQNKSLENQILLKKVYIESTHLTKEEKETRLQQVNQEMEKILFEAISSCGRVKEIYEHFLSKENSVDSTINTFELYCVRKFTVDGNFLNISKYAVDYFDPTLDETDLDCTEAIAINRMAMDYQIEQQDFSEDQSSCIITKNHEIQYFEHFAWIETMLVTKVDDLNVAKEREHYKNFYLKALQNIFNCVLDNWRLKSILFHWSSESLRLKPQTKFIQVFQLFAQFGNKIKKCESHKIMIEIAFSSLHRTIKIPCDSIHFPCPNKISKTQLTVLSQFEAKCVIKVNK